VRAISDEVVCPDVIGVQRPQSHTRAIVQPQSPTLRLLLRHLQSFLTPDAFDALVIHVPSRLVQQPTHLEVAVATKPTRQLDDDRCQRVFILPALGTVSLY